MLPLILAALQAGPAAPAAVSMMPPMSSMPARSNEPVCIRAGDLPPAFALWNEAPGDAKRLVIGKPYVAPGAEPGTLAWASGAPSARAGKAAVVRFKVARAGIYRVGLSDGAWVDVVRGRVPLASVAHGPGPICTGLHKIVDFRLAAGAYTLQLAGMPGDSVKVMIVSG